MKVKITRHNAEGAGIAGLMLAIPAALIAPITIPAILLMDLGFAHMFKDGSNEFEVDLSLTEWKKVIQAQHMAESEKKRLATLYWRYEGYGKTNG